MPKVRGTTREVKPGDEPALISVALCTYNGEAFIAQQLDSILAQSVTPAQIVVSDDGSADQTLAIVKRILSPGRMRQLGISVTVKSRQRPLGVTANFESALALCTHDLIALCDQDDVWHPEKLARLSAAFTAPDVLVVHSDARLVNSSGDPLPHSLFASLRISRTELRGEAGASAFTTLMRRNLVTGATAMVRRSLVEQARPLSREWVHDYWLAILASLQGRLVILDEPLIDYRQHGGNQIGASRVTLSSARVLIKQPLRARHESAVARFSELLRRVDEGSIPISVADRKILISKLAFENRRADFPGARKARLPHTLRELLSGQYHRLGRGMIDFVRDTWSP
jgi:glycosyltransferase involved in cell wall biosynthesis